jgi:dCTP deaminase
MILTGPAIRSALTDGRIRITPCDPDQIAQASVDLHLHPRVLQCWTRKVAKAEGLRDPDVPPLDVRRDDGADFFPVDLDETGAFLFQPGRLYLASTIERIHAPHHVAIFDGKSSTARKGVQAHLAAGYIEPGFDGPITLEILVAAPIRIPPGWPIGQIRFCEVTGAIETYRARGSYRDAAQIDGPQPSRSHLHRARHV